ncbi:HutP family protein [Thermosediminibacter litoriperuensis]|uniref:Hut operon positive regulatory protein n=1 Tax=Thermosediminibacter litoriperuensis TaxID=291989 RepID=A0A5S5AV11_9FIRM|nr:HutP family protein [Thermosediminibacter litoriperuensis]TYP56736.1 hut operon positive regulator [Thermosediminibacter litoriperuensis]
MEIAPETNIGKRALLLAITSTSEEEEALKKEFTDNDYICAVTGIGGDCDELKKRINVAVIGACLNNNIISKTPREIHAVIHATLEAKEGLLLGAPSGGHFAGKIAVVRHKDWLAVAIYGHSAMHMMTNHERVGLGIMHL